MQTQQVLLSISLVIYTDKLFSCQLGTLVLSLQIILLSIALFQAYKLFYCQLVQGRSQGEANGGLAPPRFLKL